MPRWGILNIAKYWGRSSIWLMRVICNTKTEYRGVDKIPPGPLIVASKHQSMWETFALLQFLDQPLFILKRELEWIPFFGWYLIKADMIGIDRKAGGRSLLKMADPQAREEVQRGRQLIIFPEGTRRPVGAPPDYKAGVGLIYAELRRAVHSGRAQFRPVLAAPDVHALSRERWWSSFSILCRRDCRATNSSRASRRRSRTQPIAWLRPDGVEQAQLFGRVPSWPSRSGHENAHLPPPGAEHGASSRSSSASW